MGLVAMQVRLSLFYCEANCWLLLPLKVLMQDLKPGTLLIAERPMLVSLHDSVDSAHPDNPDSPDYPLDYDCPDILEYSIT